MRLNDFLRRQRLKDRVSPDRRKFLKINWRNFLPPAQILLTMRRE